jgi:hypothetical protein
MRSTSQHFVVVATTAGPGPAAILRSSLEAAGIPAITSQEGAGAAYGLTVGPLGLVDILVPADRAAEAEAHLDSLRRGDLTGEPDDVENPPPDLG